MCRSCATPFHCCFASGKRADPGICSLFEIKGKIFHACRRCRDDIFMRFIFAFVFSQLDINGGSDILLQQKGSASGGRVTPLIFKCPLRNLQKVISCIISYFPICSYKQRFWYFIRKKSFAPLTLYLCAPLHFIDGPFTLSIFYIWSATP